MEVPHHGSSHGAVIVVMPTMLNSEVHVTSLASAGMLLSPCLNKRTVSDTKKKSIVTMRMRRNTVLIFIITRVNSTNI